MSKTLYTVLEISESASQDEIKKAYRSLAKKYHPDINKTPEAEDKFKEINSAYEVLSDAEKKSQYDRLGDSMFNHGNGQGFHQSSGMDFESILRNMFGGGGFGFNQHRPQNKDVTIQIGIPLKTAINGGAITINYTSPIDVKIPPKIKNGTKLRVLGKGNLVDGIQGDLYVVCVVQPSDNIFGVHGNDLVTVETIDLKAAIFGAQKELDLYGEKIKYNIPKNTKIGQKLRINNGLKGGSIIIQIVIELPTAESHPHLEKVL